MKAFTKALAIDQPGTGEILAGRMVWETRSRATLLRGWIGLIREGSGRVVGAARLAGSLAPLLRRLSAVVPGGRNLGESAVRAPTIGRVGAFFEQNGTRPGEEVRLRESTPYHYQARIHRV